MPRLHRSRELLPGEPRLRLTALVAAVAVASPLVGVGTVARAQQGGDDPAPAPAPAAAAAQPLSIVYHADLDGQFAEPDCLPIARRKLRAGRATSDYAALAGILGDARQKARAAVEPAPIILLGGNLAGPDLLGRGLLENGAAGPEQVASLLGRGGYDAVALGHHDLSLPAQTLDGLLAGLAARGIPAVATNLSCEPARQSLCGRVRARVLLQRGTERVGILATISPSVLAGIAPTARAGLSLEEPASAARAGVRRLRAHGATRVILMTQGPRDVRGLEETATLQKQLAAAGDDAPDVILAGGLAERDDENDSALRLLRRDGAPPVFGSEEGARSLSHVLLAAPARAAPAVAASSVEVWRMGDPQTASSGPDAVAAALLVSPIQQYCAQYQVAIAPPTTSGTLSGGNLSREAFLAYTLQVMRRRADAEVALLNRAAVKRSPFPMQAPITRGQLHQALPYRSVIGTARVTGAALEAVLGGAMDNGKLAALGVRRASNDRSSALLINGRPIDKARSYRVATIAFVASGGDAIVPSGALRWRPLDGEPDLRVSVEESLRASAESLPFTTDAADRALLVALTDVGLDLSDTRISNTAAYGDPQLTRADQRLVKGDATGILLVRHPVHEVDSRLNLKYGWTRTRTVEGAATAGESTDLMTFATVYNYRGLRARAARTRREIPDPYVRVGLESEFTRPDLSPTQTRAYHHLELTTTVGALFTLAPPFKVRAGGGLRKELLLNSGELGRWRPLVEAGATLAPVALASLGVLAVRFEGLLDYNFVDPAGLREHQLRGNAKLSMPLLPLLFITAGVDLFAVQRQRQGWAASYDSTIGLRMHLDGAHQWL